MAWKICLVLLFATSAVGLPKNSNDVSAVLDQASEKFKSFLMPGPAIIRGNAVDEIPAPKPKEPEPKNPVTCEVCKSAMQYLDGILSDNATEKEVREALHKLCAYLPSKYSDECTALVNQYAEQIIKLIVQELAKPLQVCEELGLCSASKLSAKSSSGPDCKGCIYLMTKVIEYLKYKGTVDNIERLLKGVCSLIDVKDPRRAECEKLATNLRMVINMAIAVGPEGACKLLKVCPSIINEIITPLNRMVSMATSNTTCNICMSVIDTFKSVFSDNSTRKVLENLLDMVCYYMLPIIKECRNFIHANLPKFFKYIDNLDAKTACQEMGACPKQKSPLDYRCFLGPVYRCSSLEAAVKCNTVDYCKKMKKL